MQGMNREEAKRLAARLRAIAAGESIEDLARRAQAGDEAAYDRWLEAIGSPGPTLGSFWVTLPGPGGCWVKRLVKTKAAIARETAAREALFAALGGLAGLSLTGASGMKVRA